MSAIEYSTFEKDFQVQEPLGKGSFAEVVRVRNVKTNVKYALKRIPCSNQMDLARAFNEIEVVKSIGDRRIPKIQLFYLKKAEHQIQMGILMELCGSTLEHIIKDRLTKQLLFERQDITNFIRQLVPLFAKMQKKGYMHRDIKPDNIVISQNSQKEWKVIDFGLAIKTNEYSHLSIAGTKEYASPKLRDKFINKSSVGPANNTKDDVYSFGKTLYEMMTLKVQKDVSFDILKKYFDVFSVQLLQKMVAQKEQDRYDFVELENMLIQKGSIQGQSVSENSATTHKHEFDQRKQFSAVTDLPLTKKGRKTRSKSPKETKKTLSLQKSGAHTQKKQVDIIDDNSQLKIDQIHQNYQKILKVQNQIHCLQFFQGFIILGTSNGLLVYQTLEHQTFKIFSNQKSNFFYSLKTDIDQNFILASNSKDLFYKINKNQFLTILSTFKNTFKQKNLNHIQIKEFKPDRIQLKNVRALFCYSQKGGKDIVLAGHEDGNMTVVSDDKIQTKTLCLKSCISCIQCHEDYVYFSNDQGVFKKVSMTRLGIHSQQNQIRSRKNIIENKLKNLQYQSASRQAIMSFKIIANCEENKKIVKVQQQLLAALVTFDGFLHLISKDMKCQKMIRISPFYVQASVFQKSKFSSIGFDIFSVDSEGNVYDRHGKVLCKTKEKQAWSIAVDSNLIALGTLDKRFILLERSSQSKYIA